MDFIAYIIDKDILRYLVVAAVILIVLFAAIFIFRKLRSYFSSNKLVYGLVSKVFGGLLVVIIVYLTLKQLGFTDIAGTLIGGTGFAGLLIGFAFKDIVENFLASIILSAHRPFRIGDVVEIDNVLGVVERMTIRCTVLMNFEGDHIQIPNGKVFKSTIRNITSNKNQRGSFVVGIGYESDLKQTRAEIQNVLRDHPSVLKKPKPSVIIEEFGASTMNVRVYYWINIIENDPYKVKSSIIVKVKSALERADISMPDEAREIIFPQGVPLVSNQELKPLHSNTKKSESLDNNTFDKDNSAQNSDVSEDDLESDHEEIREQLNQSASPESGNNIL